MKNNNTVGVVAAIIAAVSYGLNPFFALPMYAEGMAVDSVIFYRYIFSALILAAILFFRKQSFAVNTKELKTLITLGVLFAFSSVFLFESFNYMDAGIACTLLFVYPVMVALTMAIMFKERLPIMTYVCILMAIVGIGLLYDGGSVPLDLEGVIYVLLSAISFSAYIIIVNKSCVSTMSAEKLTFWVITFGTIVVAIRLRMLINLQPLESTNTLVSALGLALFPTVISLITIAKAIRIIGSTFTSIIGSLEPITALFIGVLVFNEQLTPKIIWGVLLILVAVGFVVAGKPLLDKIKQKKS